MSAREVVARAMYAQWQRDGGSYWRCGISWDDLCAMADEGASGHQEMRASVMNATDAALAAIRAHLAKAVPACGCTNADCQIDATREAMLKALGDE